MNIGLIDVDGHNFPNLALMKISAWHKQLGHDVEWAIPLKYYSRVYMAKVFTFSPDENHIIQADEVIKGGTGYGLKNKLSAEIEKIYPDYGLYGIKNTAYGFLTRGCPRQCDFCIVSKKEGCKSYKVADLEQFWKGQKEIKLLDPNLLACNDRISLLDQLIASKTLVDFTQGLDIRLVNEDVIEKLTQIKVKIVHFAWDKEKDSEIIIKNLEIFKKATGIDKRKAAVYILTNFDTSFEFDLYRIYKLRDLGYHPYVMIYDKANAPKKIRHLQRWVNNRIVFDACEKFENFDSKIG